MGSHRLLRTFLSLWLLSCFITAHLFGIVYLNSEEHIEALNEDSGEPLWQYPSPKNKLFYGYATISYHGIVYVVVTSLRQNDSIHAIGPDGKQIWEIPILPSIEKIDEDVSYCNNPLVLLKEPPSIFFSCGFATKYGTKMRYQKFFTMDIRTQKVIPYFIIENSNPPRLPSFDQNGIPYIGLEDTLIIPYPHNTKAKVLTFDTQQDILGPPMFFKELFYLVINSKLTAFTKTGQLRWELNAEIADYALPAVHPDGRIFIDDTNGWFYSLHPQTGKTKWRIKLGDSIGGIPAISPDSILYTSSDRNIFNAINADTGDVLWQLNLKGNLYGAEIGKKNIFLLSEKNPFDKEDAKSLFYLFAVTPDGKLKWEKKFAKKDSYFWLAGVSESRSLFSLRTLTHQPR